MKDAKSKVNKKVIIIALLVLIFSIVIPIAYSYYAVTVTGNTSANPNIVESGTMRLKLTDGNIVKTSNKWVPGDYLTKTFTVENTGTLPATYSLFLSDITNTFVDKSDLVYEISSSSNGAYNTTTARVVPSRTARITNNVSIEPGVIHSYTLTIRFINTVESQNDNMGKYFEGKIQISDSNLEPGYLPEIADQIIAKANDSDLEYDETSDNNLRYVGSNPKNYVMFNNELWRIVGVFNNIEDSNGVPASRVKIVRAESLGNYSWDTSNSSVNSGQGVNQWGESTYSDGTPYEGADLMRELNTDYLGNITVGTDGKWYSGVNNQKLADMPTSLNPTAVNLIEKVKWNTATFAYDKPNLSDMYFYERGNISGKDCEAGVTGGDGCTDNITRTLSWTGKVALIYPSDYYFATSEDNCSTFLDAQEERCTSKNWLFNKSMWTLTPGYYSQFASDILSLESVGYYSNYFAKNLYDIYPSLFLKQDLSIISGIGTSSDPYRLNIEGFDYTGSEQTYTIAKSGTYKIETWGASGGSNSVSTGGNGGYSSGNIVLNNNEVLNIYVGESGEFQNVSGVYYLPSTFNGGGGSSTNTGGYLGSGGGATDIRLTGGNWDSFNSLKSRIIVAAGGGAGVDYSSNNTNPTLYSNGASAGGLAGYDGIVIYTSPGDKSTYHNDPQGGQQNHGGSNEFWDASTYGKFGFAGKTTGSSSGGGGGYYGGQGGMDGGWSPSGGGGGSSFISGHAGCNAIDQSSTENNIIHTNQPNYDSSHVFTDTVMIDGAGCKWTTEKTNDCSGQPQPDGTTKTGHIGNGYAQITYLGE